MDQLVLAQNVVLIILIVMSIAALVIGSIALHNITTDSSPKTYTPSTSVARALQILETQSPIYTNQLQFPTKTLSANFDASFTNVPTVNFRAYEQLTFSPCDVYPASFNAKNTTFNVDCPGIQNLFGWPINYGSNVAAIDSSNYSISAVLDPSDNVYKPAVLLYQDVGGIRTLSYYLSQDQYGISWYPEVVILTLSLPPPAFWIESLSLTTLASGEPAITYPRVTFPANPNDMLDIIWTVGADGRWSSTAVNIIIPRVAPATASHYLKALVINGLPLIAFVSLGANTNIALLSSSTATGGAIGNWTEFLSPNCAGVIDRGFNAINIADQIACTFACAGPFYDLFYIQSTAASWTLATIVPVATGSATFDIVLGAITVNTIKVGNNTVPMVGVTYDNVTQFFRFFISNSTQGITGSWTTQVELTSDPDVVVTHLSATSLPDGTVACVLHNEQKNIDTNLSYTIINGNDTSTITLIPFSENKKIGTSMSVQYLPQTGRVCIVYVSKEQLDSLGPIREIGGMFVSAGPTNFNLNVNVQVNLVATGLIST
jgi:hypothetical protein